ncbi:MAG: LamG domain-containing protein [Planctomycetes bacterium]|nr:LamG domain-containing protein [Planctomycetota bacterium]
MWIYPLDTGTRHIVSFPAGWSPANGISIIQYSGNYATSCGASGNANAGQAVEINGWHHIALVRNNTSVKFYYDGVLKNTATDSTNLTGTAISLGYIVPGASSSWGSFNGYMDDVRITRGYARYTANFTPSTTTLLTK